MDEKPVAPASSQRDDRTALWVGIGLLAVLLVLLGSAMGMSGWHGGMWGDGDGRDWALWWPMGLMMAVPALLVVGAVVLLLALNRPAAPSASAAPQPPPQGWQPYDAMTILESRYARGEIGRDEFLRTRDDLQRRP